jgi:NAD+ kinase
MAKMKKPRLILLANRNKPRVVEALRELIPWLKQRAEIVAAPRTGTLAAGGRATPRADLVIVLGGDGTLLAQVRGVADRGLPVLGVNFGKLGFLAEFSCEDLRRSWDLVAAGRCPVTRRLLLDVAVFDAGAGEPWVGARAARKPRFASLALNDAVVASGAPFRMVDMEFAIDPRPGSAAAAATIAGDGVIVATPSGSTAYNVSAGGPIVSPAVEALCVTPICPHSLAFRPIVVAGSCRVLVRARSANPGTSLVIDGQIPVALRAWQQVQVRRHRHALLLMHHPGLDYWQMLGQKMHWAARPRSG